MNLWLDDIRDPANHGRAGWTWVKTADAAIEKLQTGKVEKASFDHDLTMAQMIKGGFNGQIYDDGNKSGYDVVLWLKENPHFMPSSVYVHTQNPAGSERMKSVLDSINA